MTIQEKNEGHSIKLNGEKVQYFEPGDYEVIKLESSCGDLQKISIRGSLKEGNSSGRFYEKHIAPLQHRFLPGTLFKVSDIGNDKFDHRYFYTPSSGRSNGGYYQGVPLNASEFKFKPYPNFIDFVKSFNQVGYEGGVQFRNGKKPEALLKWIFELARLKQGDRVLDFFLGSGTTAAVSHKMGFTYIGIEQTDWGINDPVKRLEAVVKGEQGGVSNETEWKGGGNFVSMRLFNRYDLITEEIKKTTSVKGLKMLLDAYKKSHSNLFSSEMLSSFSILMTTPAKKLDLLKDEVIAFLNSEQRYVNLSEINQSGFSDKISLRKMNVLFYK